MGSFYEWSLGSLGHFFRPAPQGELWYKEALGPGHEWDELIPVVIWRGSDFNYLPTLRKPREVRPLEKEGPIEGQIQHVIAKRPNLERKKQAAAFVLRQHYSELTPRWKGVSISADSEVHAKEGQLPWADIRFSHTTSGQSGVAAGSSEFKTFEEVDIATGKRIVPTPLVSTSLLTSCLTLFPFFQALSCHQKTWPSTNITSTLQVVVGQLGTALGPNWCVSTHFLHLS